MYPLVIGWSKVAKEKFVGAGMCWKPIIFWFNSLYTTKSSVDESRKRCGG